MHEILELGSYSNLAQHRKCSLIFFKITPPYCTYCISDSNSYYVIVIYGAKIKSVWIEMNISDFSPKNAYHCMSNAITFLKCSKFHAYFFKLVIKHSTITSLPRKGSINVKKNESYCM